MSRLFSIHHVRIWTGESVTPVLVPLFDFGRLCNVWSSRSFALYLWLPCFQTGTVLPDGNADCFPSQCKLQIYFHVEEKMNSLFSFVNSILACLVFSFSQSRI